MAIDPDLQAVCEAPDDPGDDRRGHQRAPRSRGGDGHDGRGGGRGARRDGAALARSWSWARPAAPTSWPAARRRAAAVSCTPRRTRESRRRGPAGHGWRRTRASPSPSPASSAIPRRNRPARRCWRRAPILARSARAASRWPDAASATSTPPPRTIRSRCGLILARRHERAVFVFHHRADRPARLGQFCEAAPWSRPAIRVIVTGDRPDWATWRRLRARLPGRRASFAPAASESRPNFAGA